MFTIRFKTKHYRPGLQVTIRRAPTWAAHDEPGIYQDDEWRFELDEDDFPAGIDFKFVLSQTYWMLGDNLEIAEVAAGGDHVFDEQRVEFPALTEAIVENSRFQQLFFEPNLDETHEYDVIVIGSGVGGGIVADQLDDLGADVLVLEAGSVLFSTHTANLPRQHTLGVFDKHLWALWGEYAVKNYVSVGPTPYEGGQAFNLGGRSIFWGGLIPRMTWWELEAWPQDVRWYLENSGYQRAEDLMFWPAPPTAFQQQVKSLLKTELPAYDHFDAPMAVRQTNPAFGTLGVGLFSTADLLTENRLALNTGKAKGPTINLNHAVVKLETNAGLITEVVAHDLLSGSIRRFRAKYVVLSAGTIESAKVAKMSGLSDPQGLVGVGLTDHPVLFTHFSVPLGKPWHRSDSASKTLSRHKQAAGNAHPYNVVLELGADLNQGRYLDPDTLALHRKLKGDAMLCEIVFLFNAPLENANRLDHAGPSYAKPTVNMRRSAAANDFWGEVDALKNEVIETLGGGPLPNQDLKLGEGALGGVAHEVGTLRMAEGDAGIVDADLKYKGYSNLFVCDLSVFPTSPAANPTLTLAALALRLADHLRSLA